MFSEIGIFLKDKSLDFCNACRIRNGSTVHISHTNVSPHTKGWNPTERNRRLWTGPSDGTAAV